MKSIYKKTLSFFLSLLTALTVLLLYAQANCTLKISGADSLTGNQAMDIVSVAKANLSKTGAQLGATEHWCADFVYNCARKAGISIDVIPESGRVSTFHDALIACGAKTVDTPRAGDLVFYGPSHVAIMADSTYAYNGNFSGKGSGSAFWTSSKVVYCKYKSATNYAQYGATFVRPKYSDKSKTLTVNYKSSETCINSDTYTIISDLICTKDGKAVNDKWTYDLTKQYGLVDYTSFGLSKTGSHFVGWQNKYSTVLGQNDLSLTASVIEPNIKNGSCTTVLTAVWELNVLTVGYNANGGTVDSTKYCLDENTGNILKLKTKEPVGVEWVYNKTKSAGLYNASTFSLKREGYKFTGWSNQPVGGTVIDQNDSTVRPTQLCPDIEKNNARVIMYACWEKLHIHTPVTDEAVAPTCTETGLTAGSHCSECNAVLTAQTVIPAAGHRFSSERVTDVAPTCTESGSSSRHCSVCDEKTDIAEIPATGHSYSVTVIEPTCTKKGYTLHTCSVCADSFTSDNKAATGHSYYERVIKAATVSESGKVSEECAVCGKVRKTKKTAAIEKTELSCASYLYSGKVRKPSVTVTDTGKNKLVKDTDFTVKYSDSSSKLPGKYTVKITFKGKYSGSVKLKYSITPKIVKGVSVSSVSKSSVKLTYSAVTGVTGYEIYYSSSKKGTYKKLASTKTLSYKSSKFASGKTVYFKVRAYKYSSGERIYGSFSKIYGIKIR